MKKITDFIVSKRYVILIFFLFLSIVSFGVSNYVKINHDMTKYLPNSSSTKIGMNIMEQEFQEDTSTLKVMLKDVTKEEKEEAYQYLKSLKYVNRVEYDNSENYNKKSFTLYILTISSKADSKEATEVYQTIKNHFGKSLEDTSGEVSEYNKVVLPFPIVVLAVVSALIILIIMCESYIEPFLFLITILLAVVLNKGTNLIFPSVSHVTNSICAILQMALSMDYSIMLMNRYRQERQKEENKVIAMKKALYHSFQSIASSSVTTIVGLLALVFMSFTIGKDLGFVLAKGVLFSLLTIFTCLPGLIILFDRFIFKTKKKSPIFELKQVGKVAYHLRFVALVLFIVSFIISYLLKGNLGILYTEAGNDEVDRIFKPQNQIAIIYRNEDEKNISNYCQNLKNKNIKEVLCYGNTINQSLEYDELPKRLNDFDTEINIDTFVLRMLYYHFYQKDNKKVSLHDMVNFVTQKSSSFNQVSTLDINRQLKQLSNFIDPKEIQKKKTANEIATILKLDKKQVEDIMIYYYSKNNNTRMTLSEFANFINTVVLKDTKYRKNIPSQAIQKLNKISPFLQKNLIQKSMDEKEMASIFSLDLEMVKKLYTYYQSTLEVKEKMTISQFINGIEKLVSDNLEYQKYFDENTLSQIKILKNFSNDKIIEKKMTVSELSTLFSIEEEKINQIYYIFQVKDDLTPYEFVKKILNENQILSQFDQDKINMLQQLYFVMESTVENKKYSYQEMALTFSLSQEITKTIYSSSFSKEIRLAPYEFVQFLLHHQNDNLLKQNIDKETIQNLKLLHTIMESTIENKQYSSTSLSQLFSLDKSSISLLYSLYDSRKSSLQMSSLDFVTFLKQDIMNQKPYKSLFTDDKKDKINAIETIMKDSLQNKKYTSQKTYQLLKPFFKGLKQEMIDLLYLSYESQNHYQNKWTFTIEKFVNYLYDDILQDELFTSFIKDDMKQEITESKKSLEDTKKKLVGKHYSRIILNTDFDLESEQTYQFIHQVQDDLSQYSQEFYIVGDSSMAYEMNQTFASELNFITILTMLFIFLVVAFTFHSILIPLILVLLIQCAIYVTMGILSFNGGSVYFISILIVQSILMGATIDYAILYTSYYLEARKKWDIQKSIIYAYHNSIPTILTSASILVIVTLIVGNFASAVAAKICKTLSQGTLCSAILIILLLPAVLSACDKWIIKRKK